MGYIIYDGKALIIILIALIIFGFWACSKKAKKVEIEEPEEFQKESSDSNNDL